jgi:hypothetical protein
LKKLAIFCKKSRVDPKSRGTRPTRGDKPDFGFFLISFDLFAIGEGRRRICGLPQSLWRQLNNHFHHHQGFLSGARVQFHLPTGVESSIHSYVSKSLYVNAFFP